MQILSNYTRRESKSYDPNHHEMYDQIKTSVDILWGILCIYAHVLYGITYPLLAFSYDEVLIPYFNFSDQRLCCSLETDITFINRYIMQHKNSFFKLYVQDHTQCVWQVAKLCVCYHFIQQ